MRYSLSDKDCSRASRARPRLAAAWLLVTLISLLGGCGASASYAPEAPGAPPAYAGAAADMAQQPAAAPPPMATTPSQGGSSDKAGAATALQSAPSGAKEPADEGAAKGGARPEQMLIFTGQLQLLVAEAHIPRAVDTVADLAVNMGGYVAHQDNLSVTVRVPSARFRDAMREMEKLGEVIHREVQAQDVSEEYYDLAVRLKSLHATRDRLEEFLKRAKTIEEVLRVEQELSRLNGQIDQIEGRMRFLASRAAFSTITAAFQPKPDTKVAVGPTEPPPPPPPRSIPLPIEWLSTVGLDRLLQLQ